MTAPDTTTITLDVDLTNPGQFLACCGLLELASRLNSEARGHFEGGAFHVSNAALDLLEQFIRCDVRPAPGRGVAAVETELTDNDDEDPEAKQEKSPPVVLGAPFNLLLDWWEDEAAGKAGFKTWSAGMTVLGFFNGTTTGKGEKQKPSPSMRQHLVRHLTAGRRLLESTEAITKPATFNFDNRTSRNIPIELGFVPKCPLGFSPAVELLALVGLQRFRPRMVDRWKRNAYHTWNVPLPVDMAAAVAHGLIPSLTHDQYVFAIKGRDAKSRYKVFGAALLERTNHAGSGRKV